MKRILFILCCLCTSMWVFAQQQTVTGTVYDESGMPMIGVSVQEKGTSNGAITDMDGKFSVKLSSNMGGGGKILIFSYIGYTTQEVSVDGKTDIKVVLSEDTEQLDEVVVVGYGVQKKSSMTAAVATVSAKEIAKQVTSNVATALQGRTPGVEVLQNGAEAGGEVSIIIRGAGTFGSTEPLYIIDGAVSNNGINSLSPNDIESIEILKDGSAAAIYGSRAANGVVLVTTKSGKSGKIVVEVNGSFSYQTPSKLLDFMNADQWRTYANMMGDNSPAFGRAPQNVNPTNPNLSTDWQDLYYQNAAMYNLSASISGGGENSTFSTSIGYTNQDGIIIQSNYEKYNARINSTYKKGRFTVTENLSIAHTSKQDPPGYRHMMIPTIPVVDDQGRYVSTPLEAGYSSTNIDLTNPLAEIYAKDSYTKKTDITGSLGITWDIWKGIKYKLNMAGSYLNTHGYTQTPAYASYWDANGTPDSRFSQPYTSLDESRDESFNYTIDNLLTYNGSFKGHTFDVLLGTSWMREFYRSMSINSGTADLGAPSVTTYNGEGIVGSNELNSALLSFFARVNYDYQDKYLLSLSIRSDKSSKFADGHRVGYFPAVSVGWNVHEEEFFDIPWWSKLKIRGSYGEMGANFIDPYAFLSLAYGPVPTILNNNRVYGYVTRLAQNDLTWETAITANAAVEMGFLNNSLTFTLEYFYKRNNDLLAPLESLPSSGQTIIVNDGNLPYYNTASVENKGVELSLGYRKDWNNWRLDVQGNISFLKNKVIKLGEGVQPIRGNLLSSKFADRPTITMESLPIGSFYGYKVVGMSDQGDFLFQGADGTAKTPAEVTENDKQILGNPTPDFTYGLNVNVGYKNWDLTAFFQGTQGNDIFAGGKYQFYFNPDYNHPVDALDSWTPTNTDAAFPIAKTDNYNGGNALPSSFYVEDGSYFRCKNLQIGYTFPEKWLKKTGFIQSARVFAGVTNLFTISSYSLYDPEVSSNTLFDRGVDGLDDAATTINSRTYNFGFNITF